MRTQIVILGGGTGGTMVANRLRRQFDRDEVDIHVVDRDDRHVYQPGLLFVPFGLTAIEQIVRPRHRQLHDGIEFHEEEVDAVSVGREEVRLAGGKLLPYHVLVVATGARLLPDATVGLTGPGWNERAFTFYTAAGAEALRDRLEGFDGGRVVVNNVGVPIKCPLAPLEFAFLADWYFREHGVRDRVELVYASPLETVVPQSDRVAPPRVAARGEGDRADHGLRRRRGRRRERRTALLGRSPDGLRPARHGAAARRGGVCRSVCIAW